MYICICITILWEDVDILQYCGKKTIQNNFTWYLKFHAGGNFEYQIKLFSIVFFLQYYNALMLSTL